MSSLFDLTQEDRTALHEALARWGVTAQLLMLAEECSECAAAALRFDRNRPEATDQLIDELADVSIMVEQMTIVFGPSEVNARRAWKLARLRARLADAGRRVRG